MSFETNAIAEPQDSLCGAFKSSAVDPKVEVVVPPITTVGIIQEVQNDSIYVESDLADQMGGVDQYLNNPGNTSILGECFAQGIKMGSDSVGGLSNKLNQNIQPQHIIASIDDGQQMDVTEVANNKWTPEFTPTPYSFS